MRDTYRIRIKVQGRPWGKSTFSSYRIARKVYESLMVNTYVQEVRLEEWTGFRWKRLASCEVGR